MIVRTLAIPVVHAQDAAAAKGNFAAIEAWQIAAICMQGIRIAIPAAALCFIPDEADMGALNMMPAWLNEGMTIGGGMVAAVGYAMVINMMATNEVWPFFALGFCVAAISELTPDRPRRHRHLAGPHLPGPQGGRQGRCRRGRLGRPARRHPGRLRVGGRREHMAENKVPCPRRTACPSPGATSSSRAPGTTSACRTAAGATPSSRPSRSSTPTRMTRSRRSSVTWSSTTRTRTSRPPSWASRSPSRRTAPTARRSTTPPSRASRSA